MLEELLVGHSWHPSACPLLGGPSTSCAASSAIGADVHAPVQLSTLLGLLFDPPARFLAIGLMAAEGLHTLTRPPLLHKGRG